MMGMSKAFFELSPDIFAEQVPELQVELAPELDLMRGRAISGAMPSPLVYLTGHTADDPPKGLHNRCDPVMSDEFIAALAAAGVGNLQCFPAELRSETDGSVWRDYQAVNVIGLVKAAGLAKSAQPATADRPGGGALLFRLTESPSRLIIARSVVDHLRSLRSDEEWGITLEALR